MIGVVATKDAMKMAEDKNLDLVKISPKAKPPVCKIMDFSKFKFEQSKKEREQRKKSKSVETKELWLSPNIESHDVQVRVKRAIDFLKSGDKVKITVRFRHGREMGRTSVANKILEDFAAAVSEFGTIDRPPKLDGRRMSMFLIPRKDLKKEDSPKEASTKENEEKIAE
jgi:translation initiation factor IF-3